MAKFYCTTKLSENISETPEGYLFCVGVPIARTGVMEYGEGETPLEVGEDGIVYVSRDAEEVFRKQTMASFEGKPITIKHPEEFVNPKNWRELTKGSIHNVRRAAEKDEDGEDVLEADLLVTEGFAISLVKAGLRELSCGYEAEYEQTGKGKGKQTKIVGNHLALVEEGRAGSSYAINDHKGKVTMGNKIAEKLKKLLGQTIDEAVAEGEKASKEKATPAKDKTKAKAKDDSSSPKASQKVETNVVTDEEKEKAYDAMKDSYDALGKMLDAMKPKAADESEEEEESEDESEEKKDKDESEDDGESELVERVKALEAAVAKLLESKDESAEEESEDESAEEESEDADLKGGEKDDSKKKTGDKVAEAREKKKTGLEKTKSVSFDSFDSKTEEMSPEKMNELNAAHWARK